MDFEFFWGLSGLIVMGVSSFYHFGIAKKESDRIRKENRFLEMENTKLYKKMKSKQKIKRKKTYDL